MKGFERHDFDRARLARSGPSGSRRLRGFSRLAESLGGVESLIGHPGVDDPRECPTRDRRAMGLTDSLVRLSVGIEEVEDLIGDLSKALATAG